MNLPLAGKVAVITGASRGIGRAITLKLAEQGAICVLCARDLDLLRKTTNEAQALAGKAVFLARDLRLPEGASELVDFAVSQFGGIDIVVNNAGATKRAEFMDLTVDDWSDGFALKFFGAVRLTRAAWPHLKSRQGSLLNIAGAGGRTPGSAFAVGGSVNAALLSFTKSLAETGLKDGVQVNAVNPGSVRTDRLQRRLETFAVHEGLKLDDAEKQFVVAEKVTRIGEPIDIANLVSFIVGPDGRFLHGALIDMDGGSTKTI